MNNNTRQYIIGCLLEKKKVGLCDSCKKCIDMWNLESVDIWRDYKIKKNFTTVPISYSCDGYQFDKDFKIKFR